MISCWARMRLCAESWQLPAEFEQDACQFFIRSCMKKGSFFVQDQMLCRVDQPLDVDPFLVQILQFGDFDLIRSVHA